MREKTFFVFMLLVVLLVVSGMVVSKSFADSAYQQAEQAGQSGEAAVQSSSDEGARNDAGQVFDTPSDSAPPVDLSGAGEHPTPQLLRNSDGSNPYTPEEYRTLRPSVVPPLPSE